MILILSNKWDVTVDFVVRELRTAGADFLRINTEDLANESISVTFQPLCIEVTKSGRAYNLARLAKVIWNRRPGKPFDDVQRENRPTPAVQRYVNDQWYSCLEALQLIDGVSWINHPEANDRMESKIRQLQGALKIGFCVPSTMVTNSAVAARAMESQVRQLVAKALYSPLIEELEQDYFIFSNRISTSDLDNDEAIRISPIIFQELINPKLDYRVTVIGETVIPVRIDLQSKNDQLIDWRTQESGVTYTSCTLPSDIEHLCREYVRQNGLLFGAIDFVESNNEFIFLEINPNGEWGWLDKVAKTPIAQTMCALMMKLDLT